MGRPHSLLRSSLKGIRRIDATERMITAPCRFVNFSTRECATLLSRLLVFSMLMMSSEKDKQALQKVVGARIRALRVARHWTQEELGGRADLDFTSIGGAERGERALSLGALQRVAAALEVHMAYLVRPETTKSGGEGEGLVEELLAIVADLPVKELKHVVTLARLHKDNVISRGSAST